MAISSPIYAKKTPGGMDYVLWGSLYVPGNNYSYNSLFLTINSTGQKSAQAMYAGGTRTNGTNPAASQSYSFNMTGVAVNGVKGFNIAATCAWSVQNITSAFQVYQGPNAQVYLQGTSPNTVVGGNGSVVFKRVSAGGGTINLAWSNGSGGFSIQQCALTA